MIASTQLIGISGIMRACHQKLYMFLEPIQSGTISFFTFRGYKSETALHLSLGPWNRLLCLEQSFGLIIRNDNYIFLFLFNYLEMFVLSIYLQDSLGDQRIGCRDTSCVKSNLLPESFKSQSQGQVFPLKPAKLQETSSTHMCVLNERYNWTNCLRAYRDVPCSQAEPAWLLETSAPVRMFFSLLTAQERRRYVLPIVLM